MSRRSERLNKMTDEEKLPGSSASESEDEKTIIEESVDDLKKEICSLKKSLSILLEKVNLQPAPTEVVVTHTADGKLNKPQCPSFQTSTTACNVFLPPNDTFNRTPNEQPNDTLTPTSHELPKQKISINENHFTSRFSPNVNLPYYSNAYMPTQCVQSYAPMPSAQTRNNFSISNTFFKPNILDSNHFTPTVQPYVNVTSHSDIHFRHTQPQNSPSISSAPIYSANTAATQQINLPPFYENRSLRKLHDLPQFDGQPEQWPMFYVSYRETTSNYNYTNLENLCRLQKALKGDAKVKVQAYLIHPENVNQIMTTLEFLYGRPQIMIRSQISKVRAYPSISGNRVHEIVDFSSMVANLTVFLENAGAIPHLRNPTLLDELVNKLPLAKREEWMKYSLNHLSQYPSVREFSMWLHEIATYISLATETDINKFDTNKREKIKPSFAITTGESRQPVCLLCKQKHHLHQCTKFRNFSAAERWNFVKNNRLCFGCLQAGHNSLKCNYRRQCNVMKCKKYHNRLLHENPKCNYENEKLINNNIVNLCQNNSDGTIPESNSDEHIPVVAIVDRFLNKKTLFKFLPVQLKGPNGYVNVMAFIDDGSKITLLEENVAKQLGLHGPRSNLSLGWIGGKTSNETSLKVNLEINGLGKDDSCLFMKNVRTTKNLRLPAQSLNFKKFKEKFPILNDILIDDYFEAAPKLLIGLPHTNLVRPFNVINIDENFSVHQTKLGNILFGSNEESTEATVCVVDYNTIEDIQQQVSEYFKIESFGMKAVEQIISDDDKRAREILRSTTVKNGMMYETGLLWKHNEYKFKNSLSVALKRLQGVEAKIRKDEDLANWYKEKINEYVLKSYARKLSIEEAAIETDRTWYLPHFVVTNVNKGNKRRLVFDAAANVEGESFNSRLMKGPSEYQPKPLLSILFKFRQRQIGVCADIREMFHRIRIRKEDQNAQRFLWRDGDSTKYPDIYVMQAMIFGSASSPCSAQYVKNLNAEIFKESEPRAYKAIVDCHYVDDLVDSFDSVNEAAAITKSVMAIHAEAGFELRGFVSNSKELLWSIDERAAKSDLGLTDLCAGETNTEKILGLCWSSTDDTFRFKLKFTKVPEVVLNGTRRPTKSEVLSLTMSIFDPIGFLANMTIRAKIVLQELWRCNTEWNSPIPHKIYKVWYEWYKELENVQYIKIPRCYGQYFSAVSAKVDLHIFVDASEVAFAAVGYWRISYEDNVSLAFVAGKSRCAPIRPLSIPRLELQAAVLGTRLKEAIISTHDIRPQEITFWSDSKTVINWIQSDCRVYKQFVSHRISEILDVSEIKQWRWIPGSNNPADDATRPKFFSEISLNSRWLSGPNFLRKAESEWPSLPDDVSEHKIHSEMRSKFILTITELIPLIKYDEKSRYYRLLRIRCWLIRAVKIFKCIACRQKKSVLNLPPYLTVQEINEAEGFWCKVAQQEYFSEELKSLKCNNPLSSKSHIYKLTPFLGQNELIRVNGRIKNAKCVMPETKEPIIMPKKHLITRLIVKHYHEKFKHQNQEAICAAIRTKFWIPCLRQLVRSAKRNCQECKNRAAVPRPPLMGQHPIDRLTPYVRPFTYTGVDYIGPFTVSIGRRTEKRWVALFTCLTVRAIHVEMAKDLSADAVILCIKNFVNRRGVPIRIRSDRGTNFIGASKEHFIIEETKIGEECTRLGIEWLFNTPANPAAGGSWERMVRCVKNVLIFTLKEKSPQVETLNSLLIEAENLVNSRPLTHLPLESSESEPLTPNHFLLGCPNIVQTPTVGEKVVLRKQWHIQQQLKQSFWKRWVLEYLPDLTRRTKWYKAVNPLKVGDIVIICDDNEARGEWKKGIVIQVFVSADGQVRSAVVKTSVGNFRRPASKLAILDVRSESP